MEILRILDGEDALERAHERTRGNSKKLLEILHELFLDWNWGIESCPDDEDVFVRFYHDNPPHDLVLSSVDAILSVLISYSILPRDKESPKLYYTLWRVELLLITYHDWSRRKSSKEEYVKVSGLVADYFAS